ncbi:hypothetical protein [Mesorhizobium sp. M7A.F.Ca.US.010.02.1.1]|uniref:hypothetical protein n=1 Tax=Mesorhizobium sp. M7A.F.Ca.US.010.02.1.1 TaxID=2496743 RepID=UPI001FDFD8EC|nr:hypothetical protein [Mesorhizobium sp. M7A.F.Ca.US.010.02.1.1]
MTGLEFPGPGLTAEQWERLKALATSLKPGQALWIRGYFAGIDHARARRSETLLLHRHRITPDRQHRLRFLRDR